MTHALEHIGLVVVFGIVLVPVYMMFVGWFAGAPKNYRAVGIGLGYLVGYIVAAVIGVAILGAAISLIVAGY